MKLKDNKLLKLPSLTGGSFQGMDRLLIPHKNLVLIEVSQRPDNGNIKLISQVKDGPEMKTGWIRFKKTSLKKKNILFNWFEKQINKDIETIYNSDFTFS